MQQCSNAGPFCYARLVEIWHLPVGLVSSGFRTKKLRYALLFMSISALNLKTN